MSPTKGMYLNIGHAGHIRRNITARPIYSLRKRKYIMVSQIRNWNDEHFTIPNILSVILTDINHWQFKDSAGYPWYRGQDLESGPIPSLFRVDYDEFNLATMFRNRASALKNTPETNRLDK